MTRNLRPRDAATLIILRHGREVLLGERSAGHRFMPHHYVFPGGGVDPGDARVPCPEPLMPPVASRLQRAASPARARALAMAAVRETFEETGLILGARQTAPLRTRSPAWQPFFARGYAPALQHLDYVARAITPPNLVRRFDARFFLVDARHLRGELRGNGELENLHWAPLAQLDSLPLASITRLVLELLQQRLQNTPPRPDRIPLYRSLRGRELIEHH